MILIVHRHVVRQTGLEIILNLVIVGVEADPAVPREDPIGVGVDHEAGQSPAYSRIESAVSGPMP